jgi:hypothetical protein
VNQRYRSFLRKGYLAVAASLFLVAGMCHSQATGATVTGVISDSTGAVVPATSVSFTNQATGIVTKSASDSRGLYRVSGLIPGTYRANVSKQGFKSEVKDGIALHVGDQVGLDFTLQVGSVSENVTVQSGEPLVDTESTTLGETVVGPQVQNAPLNGRNPMNLVALVPGVVAQGSAMGPAAMNQVIYVAATVVPSASGWGNYQIDGAMAAWNAMYLDGASVNAIQTPTATSLLVPTQDSVGEFRVDTSAISPQYGRFAGGVINFSTKSGGNKFHGTAYDYDRNTVFDAHTFFEDRFHESKSVLHQNQFGADLGGPIVRDKAFFFFSWESVRIVTDTPIDARVPTTAEEGGDFSADSAYTPANPLIDFAQGPGPPLAFLCPGGSYNKICPQHLSPVAKAMENGTPPYFAAEETDPTKLAALETNGYNSDVVARTPTSTNQYAVRIDDQLTANQRLFGRYSYYSIAFPGEWPIAAPAFPIDGPNTITNQVVVGDNYTFSPTLNLDVHLAYDRFTDDTASILNYDVAALGANEPTGTPNAWATLAPKLSVDQPPSPFAMASWFGGPLTLNEDQIDDNDIYSLTVNVNKVVGRHSFQFGGEVRRNEIYFITNSSGSGLFFFPAGGIAQFVVGMSLTVPGLTELTTTSHSSAYSYYQGYYITDAWKVSPKLTANLGVRWELPGAWMERKDRDSVLLANHANPLGSFANPVAGGPTQLMGELVPVNSPDYTSRAQTEQHLHLFEPRVGLNYSLNPRTVVRAGYGVSAPCIDCGSPSTLVSSSPLLSATTQLMGPTPAPFASIDNPFPSGINQPLGRNPNIMEPYSQFPQTLLGGSILGQEPYQTYPYAMEWNLNLERSFGSSIAAMVSYSGSRGVHMGTYDVDLNQLPDQYDSIGGDCSSTPGTGLCAPQPNPLYGIATPTGSVGGATANYGQFLRPYPEFGLVTSAGKYYGESSYNALLASFKKQFSAGSSVNLSYTWAHLISNVNTSFMGSLEAASAGGYAGAQDYTNPRADRANSDFDARQLLTANYVLDLPFGKGRKFVNSANGAVDRIVGGWSLSGITTFESGLPLSFEQSGGNNLTTDFGAGTLRPTLTGMPKKGSGSPFSRTLPGNTWFNTAAFTPTGAWSFGNESQVDSSLRAQGEDNWDLGVGKATAIKEGISLQFKGELFNLFNHPQFTPPVTDISKGFVSNGGTFGTIGYLVNNPRLVQLSLRLNF